MRNMTSTLLKVNIYNSTPIFFDEEEVIFQFIADIGKREVIRIVVNYEPENIFETYENMINDLDDNIEESIRNIFTR
jgi:hypothetical protein